MTLTTRSSFLDFAEALRSREPFTTRGALRGQRYSLGSGYLPATYFESVRRADYVVYSYGTPIAWHDAQEGLWVVPDVRYSLTTSKHQGRIRAAVSVIDRVS